MKISIVFLFSMISLTAFGNTIRTIKYDSISDLENLSEVKMLVKSNKLNGKCNNTFEVGSDENLLADLKDRISEMNEMVASIFRCPRYASLN
jgi:hypothetical protein